MARLPLLERLSLGDHICCTVGDVVVRRTVLTEVVQTGLRAGHRVVCCGSVAALGPLGPRADEALASGDLKVLPVESSLLRAGVFDHEQALRLLRREVDDARRSGYAGLRLLADMSWAGRGTPGVQALPAFEARATQILAEGHALAVCTYDPQDSDPLTLRAVVQSHLGTMVTDQPFDPACALRVRRTRTPFGLRLAGEADLMNHAALGAVLDDLLDTLPSGGATATIDLSGLRFIDTAAVRVLLRAAERAPGRLRFLGGPAALARLFDLHDADQSAGVSRGTSR